MFGGSTPLTGCMNDNLIFRSKAMSKSIDEANEGQLRDYIDYVGDKIAADEMPFDYPQWQQANFDCAETA